MGSLYLLWRNILGSITIELTHSVIVTYQTFTCTKIIKMTLTLCKGTIMMSGDRLYSMKPVPGLVGTEFDPPAVRR